MIRERTEDLMSLVTANHRKEFYKAYGDGKNDLVVLAVNNNTDADLTDAMESDYNGLIKAKKLPLIGRWTDETGKTFTDITSAENGLPEIKIKKLLEKYDQQAALIITKNGKIRWMRKK